MLRKFKPNHINATTEDFEGNYGLGRYVFFPGSLGIAKKIAESCFLELRVKEHHRGHSLYLGTLNNEEDEKIDVAAVASGMGTPSVEIFLNELIYLKAKRFLRVGTSGLLQSQFMNAGDFVVATGAVRDEGATRNYVPLEYPAIASIDIINAAQKASKKLGYEDKTHIGLLHSKDTLYAREFCKGPDEENNRNYMTLLKKAGVLASEMEASMLFILASLFNYKFNQKSLKEKSEYDKIKTGVLCVVLGEGDDFGTEKSINKMTTEMIQLAKTTFCELAKFEFPIARACPN